jgi:uncharacterized protein with FMN-binding domain
MLVPDPTGVNPRSKNVVRGGSKVKYQDDRESSSSGISGKLRVGCWLRTMSNEAIESLRIESDKRSRRSGAWKMGDKLLQAQSTG